MWSAWSTVLSCCSQPPTGVVVMLSAALMLLSFLPCTASSRPLPPHRLPHSSSPPPPPSLPPNPRLLALAVGAGPTAVALDFRHGSRDTAATVEELGRLLANVCQVVPGGVVAFFPSFSYLTQVRTVCPLASPDGFPF